METQDVTRVLIGQDVAVGTPATILAVPNGAIALYDDNSNLITGAVSIDDTKQITIVQGTSLNTTTGIETTIITGTNVIGWTGATYVAAVQPVWYIGYNGSAGSVDANNNRMYTLNIDDRTNADNVLRIERYYYKALPTGTTQEAVVEGLATSIAQLAGSAKVPLTITLIGDGSGGASTHVVGNYTFNTSNYTAAVNFGLKIVPTAVNYNIGVSLTEDNQVLQNPGLDNTTLTAATAITYSVGAGADVAEMELSYRGNKGYVNQVWFPAPAVLYANTAINYNMYVITQSKPRRDGLQSSSSPITTYIFVPTTVTLWSKLGFELTMNSWMGSLGKGLTPVNN